MYNSLSPKSKCVQGESYIFDLRCCNPSCNNSVMFVNAVNRAKKSGRFVNLPLQCKMRKLSLIRRDKTWFPPPLTVQWLSQINGGSIIHASIIELHLLAYPLWRSLIGKLWSLSCILPNYQKGGKNSGRQGWAEVTRRRDLSSMS